MSSKDDFDPAAFLATPEDDFDPHKFVAGEDPAADAKAGLNVATGTAAALDAVKKATPRTPGFFETYGDRLLRSAMPVPNKALDAVDATSRAMDLSGVKPSPSLNRMPTTGPAPQLANLDKAIEQTPAAGRQMELERAAGGKESPWGAAAGNIMGTGLQLAANPVAKGAIGGILGRIPAAAEGLVAMGAPRALASTGAKAFLGTAAAQVGQLATGHMPDETSVFGGLGAVAPAITSAGIAGSALLPNLTPEDRAGRVMMGVPGMVAGGMSAFHNAAPTLERLADGQMVRGLGFKMKDLKRAGAVDRAREIGRRTLDEGLASLFDNAESLNDKVRGKVKEVGGLLGESRDETARNMTPSDQIRISPAAIGLKAGNDIIPELKSTGALRGQLPAAEELIANQSHPDLTNGGPQTFQELNRQIAAVDDQAYQNAKVPGMHEKAGLLRALRQSMRDQSDAVAGDVAKAAGSDAYARELDLRSRYHDLSAAAEPALDATLRGMANRAVSPSSYLVATGGGMSPKSMVKAAANQMLLERGNSTAAVVLNWLAKGAAKTPNPVGAITNAITPPLPPGPPAPPVKGIPLLNYEGMAQGQGPQVFPSAGPPPGTKTPAPPKFLPGNANVNRAEQMEYRNLLERIMSGKPFEHSAIVNTDTGETLLPQLKTDQYPGGQGVRSGMGYPTEDLPPPVRTPEPRGSVLKPLSPRLIQALGKPPTTDPTRSLGPTPQNDMADQLDLLLGADKTKKSPKRR